MKKIIFTLFGFVLSFSLSAQFVAIMEVKGPLPGACDSTKVYAIFPGIKGQTIPVAPSTDKEIGAKLNKEVKFIKDHPKFKGETMINCIVNCKGELIRCEIDIPSGEKELDEQVLAVFKTLMKWTPGTVKDEAVDCVVLYSMEIKKGKIVM